MNKLDNDYVWLIGSRKRITRSIYTDGCKFYVKWYGQYIEVRKGTCGYVTVEQY